MLEESIDFETEDINFELTNYQQISEWIKQVIHKHNFQLGALTFIFCSDDYLLKINQQFLRHGEQIKDKDIVGRWRSYLSRHIDIDKMQQSCAEQWKPYMQHVHTGFTDATVFESYIEYPTDAKLLWKSCTNVFCMLSVPIRQVQDGCNAVSESRRTQSSICASVSTAGPGEISPPLNSSIAG